MTAENAPSIRVESRGAPWTQDIYLNGLHAVLDGFALRWLSRNDVELLRGVSFVVRDAHWNTARFEALQAASFATPLGRGFRVTGRAPLADGWLDCSLELLLEAGRITLIGRATARGDVRTNRTGFTILYPETAVDTRLVVEHTDGQRRDGCFPTLISPHQPFRAIRAIRHFPAPAIVVDVQMEGDIFEMEDQRNWSDASFKVYCRPLAQPFPYEIADGQSISQRIIISFQERVADMSRRSADRRAQVTVTTDDAGPLPQLGLGGLAEDWRIDSKALAALSALNLSAVLAEIDLAAPLPDLSHVARVAQALGLRPTVLARLPKLGGVAQLEALAPAAPPLAALALAEADKEALDAARRLFPKTRLGAGSGQFFAEFNRSPPPAGGDFAFWTVTPTVHAEDDASVMETLRALPVQAATARHLVPGLPLWCGPITFRRRVFPGGEDADRVDVRQQTSFGAAFTLGQITRWAEAGIESLTFYQPCGPLGVLDGPTASGAMGFFPIYRLFQHLSGKRRRILTNSAPDHLAALALDDAVWLANLTADPLTVELDLAEGDEGPGRGLGKANTQQLPGYAVIGLAIPGEEIFSLA